MLGRIPFKIDSKIISNRFQKNGFKKKMFEKENVQNMFAKQIRKKKTESRRQPLSGRGMYSSTAVSALRALCALWGNKMRIYRCFEGFSIKRPKLVQTNSPGAENHRIRNSWPMRIFSICRKYVLPQKHIFEFFYYII